MAARFPLIDDHEKAVVHSQAGRSYFSAGDEARTATISLSFLDPGCRYRAVIYKDGCDADWETNPYPVEIVQQDVTSETVLSIPQARSGGTAIRIFKI